MGHVHYLKDSQPIHWIVVINELAILKREKSRTRIETCCVGIPTVFDRPTPALAGFDIEEAALTSRRRSCARGVVPIHSLSQTIANKCATSS